MMNENIISGIIIVGLLFCTCCISETIHYGCNDYENDDEPLQTKFVKLNQETMSLDEPLYITDYEELNK